MGADKANLVSSAHEYVLEVTYRRFGLEGRVGQNDVDDISMDRSESGRYQQNSRIYLQSKEQDRQ